MALSPQILATTLVVGGVSIGIPVYFVATKNTFVNSPRLVQFIEQISSSGTSQVSEFSQKVKCGILDNHAGGQVSKDFLEERHRDEKLYRLAFCNSTNVDFEDISPLGKNWSILFPKNLLNTPFSLKTEGEFEMDVKTTIGNKNSSDFVTSVFSNLTNESSIKARWVDLLDTKHLSDQKAILITIEEDKQNTKEIYLLLNS